MPPKTHHEIRDPIHIFVRLLSDERKIIDSRPVQRMRHVHQLALTHLVYPGATHRRFEHSLGVVEVASRIFDVVTKKASTLELLPDLADEQKRLYWRSTLRYAALLHDVGHLPFSHAAEHDLLPKGWNHEFLSRDLIKAPEIRTHLEALRPQILPEDVVKLALGQKKYGQPMTLMV